MPLQASKKAHKVDQETPGNVAKKLRVEANDEDEVKYVVLPYDVLIIMFGYFKGKDLCNSAMTCRLWREIAEKELKRRKIITGHMDLYLNREFGPDHEIKELENKPMLSLLFHSTDNKYMVPVHTDFPKACIKVEIANPGVVINSLEMEHHVFDRRKDMVYGFLPDDPHVHIECLVGVGSEIINLNKKMKKIKPQPHRTSFVEPMVKDTLKRLKDIKCMILFTSDSFKNTEKLTELDVFKDTVKVVWGGNASKIIVRQADRNITEKIHWLALMIAGPKVQCWSTLLTREDNQSSIEKKLQALKERVQFQTHTLGFMFACVERGSRLYDGEKNVEASLFRKFFPQVPLIGSFGCGEHGTYDDDDEDPFVMGLYHQYSTAFMVLTYA